MSAKRIALLGMVAAMVAACETAADTGAPPPAALEHVQVHEVPGLTKQQLCTAARDWAALTFKDSKAVVEVFDAEQGKMIGKGRVDVAYMLTIFPVSFTLLVECRDGRARASYTNLTGSHNGNTFPVAAFRADALRNNAIGEMRRIDGLLGAYLKNPRVGGQW